MATPFVAARQLQDEARPTTQKLRHCPLPTGGLVSSCSVEAQDFGDARASGHQDQGAVAFLRQGVGREGSSRRPHGDAASGTARRTVPLCSSSRCLR